MDLESSTSKRRESRAERESDLETAKNGIRSLVENSKQFTKETKEAITKAIDVSFHKYMSSVLDHSNSEEYKDRSARGQAYFYLHEKIKKEVGVVEDKEKEELDHLLKWIELVRN